MTNQTAAAPATEELIDFEARDHVHQVVDASGTSFLSAMKILPEERREAVFVRHPLLGDLNLVEWVRFHYLHCRHHAREIRDRVRWLEATRE